VEKENQNLNDVINLDNERKSPGPDIQLPENYISTKITPKENKRHHGITLSNTAAVGKEVTL
jgi:hypothetical protein